MDGAVAQLPCLPVGARALAPGPLDGIIARPRIAPRDVVRPCVRDMIGEFVAHLLADSPLSADIRGSIGAWMGEIDAMISDGIDPILLDLDEEVERLEASWRGLLLEIRQRLSDLLIEVGHDDRPDQALPGPGSDPDTLKPLGAEAGRAQPHPEGV
jgi:hypothetical protein